MLNSPHNHGGLLLTEPARTGSTGRRGGGQWQDQVEVARLEMQQQGFYALW